MVLRNENIFGMYALYINKVWSICVCDICLWKLQKISLTELRWELSIWNDVPFSSPWQQLEKVSPALKTIRTDMPCTHPSTANKYVSAFITDIVTFYFMIISPVSCRAECKDDGILKQSHRSDIKRCCERDHVTLEGVLMCVLHLHRLSPQMPEKKTVMTHLFF